jgi:F-type H+-transporting ATPase subunit b
MRGTLTFVLALAMTSPAFAASGPFVSLKNTNSVVLLAFLLFIAVLIYLKVPSLLGGMLDKRAEGIKSELDEARALREEAQTILASYERKMAEVKEQAEKIVAAAKEEAVEAAELAKRDLEQSIVRRIAAAEDQIASAEAVAVREVRDQAIAIATTAAAQVISKQMTAAQGNALIDASINEIGDKLH